MLHQQTSSKIKKQDLDVADVAKMFVNKKIFMELSSAKNYLWQTLGEKKQLFEYNDFLSIFVKGILKDIVCGIADTVHKFMRRDEIYNLKVHGHKPIEKTLLWKLSDYKR